MIHDFHTLAEHDVSWLAIRQPAVIRLLECELASTDGDAFAAGLELACRVLGGRTPLRDQIDELPIVLSQVEQYAVATVIAAVIWAVLDASGRDLDDVLVA